MPERPYVIDQMISAKAIAARVEELQAAYLERVRRDFHASAPPPAKATE